MINGRHHGDADDDADEKVAFEGLLLGFMAKGCWPTMAPGQPPVTPNTSNVASGTLRIPFRAAILSAPYMNNVITLIARNHMTREWVARRLPIAAIIRSK